MSTVLQRGHGPGSYIGPHKKNTSSYDDYSNYSDGNYNEEDDDDYAEQLKHYRQAKDSPNMGEPPYKKMNMKGGELGKHFQIILNEFANRNWLLFCVTSSLTILPFTSCLYN